MDQIRWIAYKQGKSGGEGDRERLVFESQHLLFRPVTDVLIL